MGRKLSLPVTQRFADSTTPPTIDGMRARLGGRLQGRPGGSFPPGTAVTVGNDAGSGRVGILLVDDGGAVDVYLERGLVKRTAPAMVARYGGDVPEALAAVAEQARVFGSLAEGQRVHVEQGDTSGVAGVLREKCRYGGLVECDTGKMLGVGFRKLWPSAESELQS